MQSHELQMYKEAYNLHRLFYETAEESRDDKFWCQIKDGISLVCESLSLAKTAGTVIHDVIVAHSEYTHLKQLGINMEQKRAAEREREENAKAEAKARAKQLAEIDRLERELEQARAGL